MIDNEAPLVLDGGLGSELDARGYDVSLALSRGLSAICVGTLRIS
jgi:S-methylmethionine-dependent homocysteine/selenocysteine methylase